MPEDTEPDQRVTFGPGADGFAEVLGQLAGRSEAVTITLGTGETFGAVLLAVGPGPGTGVVIFERWDDDRGQPSGEPGTLPLDVIAEVRVE